MRHLRSILYALVLAPAAWILCGVGFDQDLTGRARDNGGVESLTGLLLLLLAGAAYGILLLAPISPAGPLLAGTAFLGIGAWARIAPESYADIWPADVTKEGFNVSTPGYGLVVLLAVPLVCTALSARRWAAYEPPRVVFLGTLGGARGTVPAPGTPMAAERTTVFAATGPAPVPQQRQPPRPAAEEPTRDVAESDDRTTALPTAAITIPAATDDGEKTQLIRPADDGERTQLIQPDVPGAGETPARATTPTAAKRERPADEAQDATRPLNLPVGDEQTRPLQL